MRYITIVLVFLLGAFEMQAQTMTVSGVVTSAGTGETLIGVNVIEKDGTAGTVTGLDGDYSIEVASGAVLLFSYIGFESVEVPVGNQSVINIEMNFAAAQLDEIVVVTRLTLR